jgi:hypothetical protein
MNQEKYNDYCDTARCYKKVNLEDEKKQSELDNYLNKVDRLLLDEYKYGSSWLDIHYLEKYLNKCEEFVQLSGH